MKPSPNPYYSPKFRKFVLSQQKREENEWRNWNGTIEDGNRLVEMHIARYVKFKLDNNLSLTSSISNETLTKNCI